MMSDTVRLEVAGPPVGRWFRAVVGSVWALLVMTARTTVRFAAAVEGAATDRASRVRHLTAFALAAVAVAGLAGVWWGCLTAAALLVVFDLLVGAE